MIAAVNGSGGPRRGVSHARRWSVALAFALLWAAPRADSADDLNGAARELARRTAAFAGKGEPVLPAWRNLSSLPAAELAQARAAFETAVREAGARVSGVAPLVEARLTVSENAAGYLLVV